MPACESINTGTLKIEKPITFVYWKILFLATNYRQITLDLTTVFVYYF